MNNKTLIAPLRKSKGWTQEMLAEKSGLSIRTIQRMESGVDTSLDTLRLVAEALGVPVNELFESIENGSKEKEIERFSEEQNEQNKKRQADDHLFGIGKSAYFVLMLILAVFLSGAPESEVAFWGIGWLALFLLGFAMIKYLRLSWWNKKLDVKYPLTKGIQRTQETNSDDFLWWKSDVARPVLLILYCGIIPLIFILKYAVHLF